MKIKTLLTALLAGAVIVGAMTVSAMAEEVVVEAAIDVSTNTTYTDTTFVRKSGYTGAFFNVTNGTLTLDNCVIDAGAVFTIDEAALENEIDVVENGGKAVNNVFAYVDADDANVNTTETLIKVSGGNLVLSGSTIQNMYSDKESSVIVVKSEDKNEITLVDTVIKNVVTNAHGGGVISAASAGKDTVTLMGKTIITDTVGQHPGAMISIGGGTLDNVIDKDGTTLNINGETSITDNIAVNGSVIMVRRADVVINGGRIADNYCLYTGNNKNLSPIYIHDGTVVEMTGGEVSDNYGYFADAIVLRENSVAKLTGGEISGGSSKNVNGSVVINSPVTVGTDMTINDGLMATNIAPVVNNGTINGEVVTYTTIENNGTINGDVVLAGTGAFMSGAGEVKGEVACYGAQALIGTTKYTTLVDAIANAAAGETITLVADIETDATIVINRNVTIDGDGYTVKGKDVTETETNGTAVTPITINGAEVTLVDITVKGGNAYNNDPYQPTASHGVAGAGISVNNGKVIIDDSTIAGGDAGAEYTKSAGSSIVATDGDIVVTNSTLATGRTTRSNVIGVANVYLDATSTIDLENVTLDTAKSTYASDNVIASVHENGQDTTDYTGDVNLDGEIVVLGTRLANVNIVAGENLTLKGNIDASYIADTITVKYVKKDVDDNNKDNDEEADLYDIVLEGDAQFINRLTTADLTFKLDSETKVKPVYEILPVKPVVITTDEDYPERYMFNFDGVTQPDETSNNIVIGQVKISGYGAYTFGVATEDTNLVNATKTNDSIVENFIPGGAEKNLGELVVNATIEDEIIVPTRDLTINIDFPNAVEKQVVDYQQMKVTVSGGDLAKAIVIDLGDEDTTTAVATEYEKKDAKFTIDADAAYTVKVIDVLTVNTSYTVTVEGAGYRTYRYTVTMTGDKTLNFWNNVKDNDTVVEKDKKTEKVTYLAGDIVKDSLINVYDLSAVVSYFGETGLVGTNNTYAKYDLNRDGKIDSKDVAYVLVSWGK